ncbi:MAG: 6-phosphofructokinase, partial [Planctomycetes bacterium]|nr:6-phosphofructokinase [Planctomycetota bacterium]
MKRIGILTGGGDCPGLNAVIRAVTRRLLPDGYRVLGIRDGWKGLMERDVYPLTRDSVSGILHLGGTILGTSRTNPFKRENVVEHLQNVWRASPAHAGSAHRGSRVRSDLAAEQREDAGRLRVGRRQGAHG